MAGNLLNQVQPLLHTPQPPSLGPGPRPHVESDTSLRLKVQELARAHALPPRRAQLICALALLWHDRLEAAHRLVQEIDDAEGSLIHAMMHRREPDYANAKYWWRRVGAHPVFAPLAEAAEAAVGADRPELARRLVKGGRWDPIAFVDECQRVAGLSEDDPEVAVAVELQRLEFDLVLAHLCA